jgi:DnaJ family protein C protein 7
VIALSLSVLKLRQLEDAIEDCTNAVKLDDTYIKAYLRRAQW